jgi:hypothetical protein
MMFLDKYPYVTPLEINSNEPFIVSESLNLQRRHIKDGSQRFEFSITLMGGFGEDLMADLMTNWMTYGMDTPFEIDCPQHFSTEKAISGSTVTVSVDASAGETELTLLSVSSFNIPSGRLVSLGEDKKLYAVVSHTAPEYVGSQFVSTLQLSSGLVATVLANSELVYRDVKAKVLNEPENASFKYSSGVLQQAGLRFVEYLT